MGWGKTKEEHKAGQYKQLQYSIDCYGYNEHNRFMAMNTTISQGSNRGIKKVKLIPCNKNGSDVEPDTPFNFSEGNERALQETQMDFEPDKIAGIKEELLRWHIILNHIPFNKIWIIAQLGMIPKRMSSLKTGKIPTCASCINRKAT